MLIVHRNLPLMGLFQHVLSLLHVLRFFVRAMVLYQLGAPRLHCEPALHEWAAGREDEHSPRSVPGQRVAARLQARDVPHGCAQRLPRCAHVVHLVAGMSSAVSRVAVPVPAPPFLRIPAPHGLMHVRNRGRRRAQRKRGAQADAAGRRRSHADAGPYRSFSGFPSLPAVVRKCKIARFTQWIYHSVGSEFLGPPGPIAGPFWRLLLLLGTPPGQPPRGHTQRSGRLRAPDTGANMVSASPACFCVLPLVLTRR